MSATVILAGAGEIGSRHLQAIGKASFDCTVHVYDPSEAALSKAMARLGEQPANPRVRVEVTRSLTTLPRSADLAIVATTSNTRAAVLTALMDHASVRTMLLEKILFSDMDDYDRVEELFKKSGTSAWVNCPRRLYPFYIQMRSSLRGVPPLVSVHGGEWGLACNGIHFVDLLSFLTGRTEWQYDTSGLDEAVRASKRAGFVEFSGTLRVYGGDAGELLLHSTHASQCPPVISLSSAACAATVDEAGLFARLARAENLWKWEEQTLTPQYQSTLTHRVAEEMIFKGTSGLSSFSESAAIHRGYLLAFLDVFNRIQGTPANRVCPVT